MNRAKRVSKSNVFAYKMIAHNYLYKQDRLWVETFKLFSLQYLPQRIKYLERSQCRLDLLIFLEFFGSQNGVCDKFIM